MMSRRLNCSCLVLLACLLAFLSVLLSSRGGLGKGIEGSSPPSTLAELRELRKQAAQRQRRIVSNNDGDDVTAFLDKATPKEMLKVRTAGLLDTQVDTISYNTGYCFGNVLHRSKIGTTFVCKEGGFANNKVADLVAQGTDGLEIVTDFCRQNGIEIFWAMRMNDIHDGHARDPRPIPNEKTARHMFPPFKADHPELLMGSLDKKPKIPFWTSVDYSHAEVRNMAFRLIEEVCQNYDIDGIDMDFFRHLPFFKSVATGGSASQDDLDKMTQLIRRIRSMTEEVGLKRGRPILISVRVPDSVEYCRASGFDIVRWMDEGLIDIMVLSGYFRLNPWDKSVALGHAHGIQVYPCLSDVRRRDAEAAAIRSSVECLRGRAAEVWQSGADGVYMFNFWDTTSPIWKELGGKGSLSIVNKVYTTGARGQESTNRFLRNGARFVNRSTVSPATPRKLVAGTPESVELVVGEHPGEAERRGARPDHKLMLRIAGQTGAKDIAVKLNGTLLGGASAPGDWIQKLKPLAGIVPPNSDAKSHQWVAYSVNPDDLRGGINAIVIEQHSESDAVISVEDLVLWIRYLRADGRGQWKFL